MNRFTLTGHLGEDAQILTRTTRNNAEQTYARLSLAVNRPTPKDQDNKTDWFTIWVYNSNLVELMQKFGTKGKKLLVEGSMERRVIGEGDNRQEITTFILGGFGASIELMGGGQSGNEA
ncbi:MULTISPECIES: single-stranded DNA-binding protein [Alphaproteobacteria]|jgi:single-strand DNA-binding protein|uniref:Single-stranded DNA-binding protein n=1 Tax=Maricaulis virginensis TaxID=144022 RepID=A0A9W6IPY8_9PROT|nr:single-stranded DNA-binding protein [Maricaulis virginensis]GLK53512.1 hypothetical protein GCM10017621_30200 [Maricaulis virginensis]